MICKVCLDEIKNFSHIRKEHHLTHKEYYDQYIKDILKLEGLCRYCGKPTRFISNVGIDKLHYALFCSRQCAGIAETTKKSRIETCFKKYGTSNVSKNESIQYKHKQTCLNKYGVENVSQSKLIQDKKKNNCLEKYGVEHPHQLKEVQEKIKQTCLTKYGVPYSTQVEKFKRKKCDTFLNKYGVNNPSKLKIVKEKIGESNRKKADQAKIKREQTCINLYGVKSVFSSVNIQKKIKKTNLKKYGVEYIGKSLNIIDKIKDTKLKINYPKIIELLKKNDIKLLSSYTNCKSFIKCLCLNCNAKFETSTHYIQQGYHKCPMCFPLDKSTGEKEIAEFIAGLGFRVERNIRKIIKPLELDIYIPEKKNAIEYNGLYWHSEKINNDKNYHLNKLKQCQEKDIKLIQIFEDEWLLKQDIVKARLKQILNISNSKRIHARKCIIKEIDSKLKNEFLEKYHLQGKDNSKIKLGAFYNEELVSVMTFSKGNISKGSKAKEDIWELNRFCSNYDYHIPGIASKLLAFFKMNYKYKQIFSYADRRWSTGNVYYKLGFELEKETIPNYWYVKGLKRIHRFNLRKRPDEPKDIPESILRASEGYNKIWDCGHLKFVVKGNVLN